MKTNYFNYEQSPDGSSLTQNHFIDWLGSTAGRKAIHVGNQVRDTLMYTMYTMYSILVLTQQVLFSSVATHMYTEI